MRDVVASVPGLIPVVKGNGYGFGITTLAAIAADLSDTIAVGTVHELGGLPPSVRVVVLTPTMTAPKSTAAILTVGSSEHIAALTGWQGSVIVKLTSDMNRFGGPSLLVEQARSCGLSVIGVSIHPSLAATENERVEMISAILKTVDVETEVWLSHLSPSAYSTLPTDRRFRLRLGTHLWHGARQTLHLEADVLAVREVTAGEKAGYRLTPIAADGTLLMIGAGSANGVAALPDGRSPFHLDRVRLPMLEPPHMHTSMVLLNKGARVPDIGTWVDLQRPLTMTAVDCLRWT